jgi:cell division protein FtsA
VIRVSVYDRPERVIEKKVLANIIEERLIEIFELIKEQISKTIKQDVYGSRVVLTGGSSLLYGMPDLVESVLEMPVRVGKPLNITGVKDFVDSPIYSTAVGLIRYGIQNNNISYPADQDPEKTQMNVRKSIVEFLKRFF